MSDLPGHFRHHLLSDGQRIIYRDTQIAQAVDRRESAERPAMRLRAI
jgi:hypothetical protein